jgi:hypothetical protein
MSADTLTDAAAAAAAYREAKIQWVTGHKGTTHWEIINVVSVLIVSPFLDRFSE